MVVFSLVDVDNEEDVGTQEVAEQVSNVSVKVVEVKDTTTHTTAVEVVVVPVVAEDSAGRIMTSHNVTVMLRSILSRTGKCWRRSISTALPS